MSASDFEARSFDERSRRASMRPVGVVFARAVLVLLLAALTLALAARHRWWADLFAHFRLHYAAALIVWVLPLWGLRQRLLAGVALLAGMYAFLPAWAYLDRQSSANASTATSLRVISFNVWKDHPALGEVAEYLEGSDADVLVLQELSPARARFFVANLPSYPHRWLGAVDGGDVGIFSRLPIASAQTHTLAAGGVDAAKVTLRAAGQDVTIIGLHLHWPLTERLSGLRNAELAGLAQLARQESRPTLVLGDFNLTPWSPYFDGFAEQSALTDCALAHGLDATWPASLRGFGIRIDHCFASQQWRILDVQVGPNLGSDHRPVTVLATMGPL